MTMYPPTEEGYQDRPCNEPGCPTINDQGEGKGCACPGCKDSVQGNVGGLVRTFETGATRDVDHDKLDPEGFLSPLVIKAFSEYMHENRKQKDGSFRSSDNWQKGIPKEAYMKSGWRHFLDWWMEHRGYGSREGMVKALCGLMFNVMGYLHEVLKEGK